MTPLTFQCLVCFVRIIFRPFLDSVAQKAHTNIQRWIKTFCTLHKTFSESIYAAIIIILLFIWYTHWYWLALYVQNTKNDVWQDGKLKKRDRVRASVWVSKKNQKWKIIECRTRTANYKICRKTNREELIFFHLVCSLWEFISTRFPLNTKPIWLSETQVISCRFFSSLFLNGILPLISFITQDIYIYISFKFHNNNNNNNNSNKKMFIKGPEKKRNEKRKKSEKQKMPSCNKFNIFQRRTFFHPQINSKLMTKITIPNLDTARRIK